MSARTINRKGGGSARQTASARAKAAKVRSAKARTGSLIGQLLARLPFSEAQLYRGLMIGFLGAALLVALLAARAAGVPALALKQFAAIAASSGFEVRRVEVRGVKRLNELKVYERALASRDQAMPLVDVAALRADLLELSWVQDARVSRQLPDTLVIDIVERRPHAALRQADRLVLIDATGHKLEAISPARARGKLMLSGPGADRQVAVLAALTEAAPALKPQIREAEWVGNRRWNLTFRTGQVLALPEGHRPAADALVSFARLDGINRLIGGKVAAFDMRSPGRVYMRIPGRTDDIKPAGETAAASGPKAAPKSEPKPKSTEAAKRPAIAKSEDNR
jgi:cell division protein FtsQ